MSERDIEAAIRLKVGSQHDVVLWRNAVGFDPESKTKYGLFKGSSDLIGIGPGGRFLAIEVKTATGRPTEEQMLFLDLVETMGGIACLARSADDAMEAICAKRENRVYQWRNKDGAVPRFRGAAEKAQGRPRKTEK
jgi:hypothetical protein